MLEVSAAELRKKAENAPSPGRRLDLLESFLRRAEARLEKGTQRVLELEAELANARSTASDLQKELDQGRDKLAQLRAELWARWGLS